MQEQLEQSYMERFRTTEIGEILPSLPHFRSIKESIFAINRFYSQRMQTNVDKIDGQNILAQLTWIWDAIEAISIMKKRFQNSTSSCKHQEKIMQGEGIDELSHRSCIFIRWTQLEG